MHLQRWPDGLHAAIQAKERGAVSSPGVILDTVTIQDLLLNYRRRSGMSGTVTAVTDDLKPRVLNGKNDGEEAWINARAGELGAVTISTRMSRRGTDMSIVARQRIVDASQRIAEGIRLDQYRAT